MIRRKVGIIGIGMVGGAVRRYFEKKPNYELFLYDKNKKMGSVEEVNKADFIYICVPTPYKEKCDTSIVEEVISGIKGEKVIIIKSTVIPGTTERLQKQYEQHKILFNPEFLTEATADQDFSFPDRQIVGYTERSYNVAKDVLQQLPLAPFERIVPATVAEMIKYFSNAWFTVKVVFANQMYDLCQKLGIDYDLVRDGASADRRIGRTHLKIWHNGFRGAGGKCLPKDLKALLKLAEELEVDMPLLKSTDLYNDKLIKSQGLDPLNTDKDKPKKDNDPQWISGEEIKK